MRYCFIFIAFVSLLCSCKGTQPVDDADVLVKVKDRTLRRSEIKQQIPRGLSSADSKVLHAGVLGFDHPITGEYMEWHADLPDYFQEILKRLR